MDINVFLICYNESAMLPHTIHHYRKNLPSCKITIYDNQSTDDSVAVATALGCKCIEFDTGNKMDEIKMRWLRNNCWKSVESGWIIMADMDEYICVTEDELLEEMQNGTSILKIQGWNMVGETESIDLKDIDLQSIKKFVYQPRENKNLCFLREKITDMNFTHGSHECYPVGDVVYSSKTYINKHMVYLGLNFFIHKNMHRFVRNDDMRKIGMNVHYSDNIEKVKQVYMNALTNCNISD